MTKNFIKEVCLNVYIKKIQNNFINLQNLVGNECSVMPVFKSGCYGLDIDSQIIPKSLIEVGMKKCFIGYSYTGVDIINSLKDINHDLEIYLLYSAQSKEEFQMMGEYNIKPVVASYNDLEMINEYNNNLSKYSSNRIEYISVSIDYKMNRNGFKFDNNILVKLEEDIKNSNLKADLIFSHASIQNSEDMNNIYNAINQIVPFANIPKSISSTNGLKVSSKYKMDAVRIGSGLYVQIDDNSNDVISLSARVMDIRHVKKGEQIGYKKSYTAEKDSYIATISIGYQGGYENLNLNSLQCFYQGEIFNTVGVISMDTSMIDITKIYSSKKSLLSMNQIKIGDSVEIIGPNITIDQFARNSSISYARAVCILSTFPYKNYIY